MIDLTFSVSQLNDYVRKSLASDPLLQHICITGEISNLKMQFSGHWYFVLKDENAAVNCAMFRQNNMMVRFQPENGMKVRLFGSVGLYAKTGSYQFYVDSMEQEGLGNLYLQFEALKNRLQAQGLFDPSVKKPLPFLPKGIGIVTSQSGAVIHDIARVAWTRFPGIPLYLYPAKVQGDGAAEELAKGLEAMDRFPAVDVLIVGRGGGSMEDLWCFNEETVARAVYACRKPVISAVGHETDFTICDFTADVRAATPSAAAEIAVPSQKELFSALNYAKTRINRNFSLSLIRKKDAFNQAVHRLELLSPLHKKQQLEEKLSAVRSLLQREAFQALEEKRHRLEKALIGISAAGPEQALARGYLLLMKDGKTVTHLSDIAAGDHVTLRGGGAEASAAILEVREKAGGRDCAQKER